MKSRREKVQGTVETEFQPLAEVTKAATFVAAMLACYPKDMEGMRDLLPEPFDFFDHAGNAFDSLLIGWFTAVMTRGGLKKLAELRNAKVSEAVIRAYVTASAFVAGTAANVLSETPLGTELFPNLKNGTLDLTDLAYGVIFASVGSMLAPKGMLGKL